MTTTIRKPFYEAYGGSAPESYERYFVPAIGGPLAHDLVGDAALKPGERVLAKGGRVLASVPTPTEFFGVLDAAFARRIPDAAAFVRAVFSLNDPAEVERLFRGAAFQGVVVRQYTRTMQLPAPRDFLWQYVQCTPLAAQLAEADHALLESLERDVVAGWQPWTTATGMRYDQGMIVATARRG
jgi:hypothetical protein